MILAALVAVTYGSSGVVSVGQIAVGNVVVPAHQDFEVHACQCHTGRVQVAAPSSVRSYHKTSYHRRTSTFPVSTTSPTNGQHLRHFPEGITPSNLTSGLLGFSFMKFSAGGRCPIQVLPQECFQGWTSSEMESGQVLNG